MRTTASGPFRTDLCLSAASQETILIRTRLHQRRERQGAVHYALNCRRAFEVRIDSIAEPN
jgi:hypothetical protein